MDNTISSINFKGLWAPVKKVHVEKGHFNKDYVRYTLNNLVYHPFKNETSEEIAKEVTKHTRGRNFSLWDRVDGQHKGDYFQMNHISIGKAIDENDTEQLLNKGYNKLAIGGVLDEADFKDAWNNNTYYVYDINNMQSDEIEEVISRVFGKQK